MPTEKIEPLEAWRIIGVPPGTGQGALKKAYRRKVANVHPDVIGGDGTELRRVQVAFKVLESLTNPLEFDREAMEEGLPQWAAGLLSGVQWTDDCGSFADFLSKPTSKALAIGEYLPEEGVRPWGAAWGKYTQTEANQEALRICRQHSSRCRLIWVGSGEKHVNPAGATPESFSKEEEQKWWTEKFGNSGHLPGFGWMPEIDKKQEKLLGYKTIDVKSGTMAHETRVRVPVFRLAHGGKPYYYTPEKPGKRTFFTENNFKHTMKPGSKRAKRDHNRRVAKAILMLNKEPPDYVWVGSPKFT